MCYSDSDVRYSEWQRERLCTTPPFTSGGSQIVESTDDHVQLKSLEQWGLDNLMSAGRRP